MHTHELGRFSASRWRQWAVSCGALALVVHGGEVKAQELERALEQHSIRDLRAHPENDSLLCVVSRADVESNETHQWIALMDASSETLDIRTNRRGRAWHPRWSPDGSRFAYLAENENGTGLYIQPAGAGESQRVEVVGDALAGFRWHPDSQGMILAIRDTARDLPPGEDAMVVGSEPATRLYYWRGRGGVQMLTADEHVGEFDIARVPGEDGARVLVAFTSQPSAAVPDERLHSDLKWMDLADRRLRPLVTRPGMDHWPRFSPDGEAVGFVTMGGEAQWLANYRIDRVNLAGDIGSMTEAFDERVQYHAPAGEKPFAWLGTEHLVFMGADGLSHRLFSRIDGAIEPLTAFDEQMAVKSFDAASGGIYFVAAGANAPEEIYWVGLEDQAPVQRTRINAALADVSADVQTERIEFDSGSSGQLVEALLVRTQGNIASGESLPLLVMIHGGPMGRYDWDYAPRRGVYPVHALARAGFAVLLSNPRGSGGYGASYRQAIIGEWGHLDYEDIMAGVDHLIDTGVADADRLGVMGWSYGGYLTSWIITQTDQFVRASIGAPIVDTASFFGTTDIPDFMESYFGGPPWASEFDYDAHSPLRFIDQAATPALILHGAADRRVPPSQSQALYRALSRRGIETQLVVYPRSRHSLTEPKLILDAMQRNFEWFATLADSPN